MRTRRAFLVVAALMAVFVSPSRIHAQSNVVTLTLERSTNGLSDWQIVQVTTNTVPAGLNAFYRMKIAALPPTTNNMITVQGGTLPQSSQLAGTVVATFRIGKYEVTWDEWLQVRAWAATNGYTDLVGVGAGSTGNHPAREVNWYDVVKWSNAKSEKEGLTPVYRVSGAVYRLGQSSPTVSDSANGYRLPTEAEWEWAARGGVSSQGYIYSGSNDLNGVGWYFDNSIGAVVPLSPEGRGTWPVGAKAPNELGLHDMSGNVWEWCADLVWDSESVRLGRGGSWRDVDSNCGVVVVDNLSPTNRYSFFGLRVARNAP